MNSNEHTAASRTGPAAAAFLAAGIGCAALGILVPLAEASSAVKDLLNWWDPAGPLTGKTGAAVALWVLSWAGLHLVWREKMVGLHRTFSATLFLVALGGLGTFPTFFALFAAH